MRASCFGTMSRCCEMVSIVTSTLKPKEKGQGQRVPGPFLLLQCYWPSA